MPDFYYSDTVDFERDCAEHVHWHPYVTVEKYSPDQTEWAEARLRRLAGWRRYPVLRRVPLGERDGAPVATLRRHAGGLVRDLHGSWLRELFPRGPEDGYAYDDGNLLVNQGLTNIIKLLVGTAVGGAVNPMTTAKTVVGVGSSSTAATTSDVHLGADGTSAYYQGSDTSFPSLTTPATINNQCTFASGNANFSWNEWCWATGDSISAAGATLSSVFTTSADVAMINHKVPISSLGTKASGASWVFSTTIVFS